MLKKSDCMICGEEYEDYASHNINGNSCSVCGTNALTIETEHSPYANSINYKVLGTWDFSDAKSVEIIITYQTESQYQNFII